MLLSHVPRLLVFFDEEAFELVSCLSAFATSVVEEQPPTLRSVAANNTRLSFFIMFPSECLFVAMNQSLIGVIYEVLQRQIVSLSTHYLRWFS